jgi:hypothetical protein
MDRSLADACILQGEAFQPAHFASSAGAEASRDNKKGDQVQPDILTIE